MLSQIIKSFAVGTFALSVIACGGNEPATPEQRKDLTALVQSATEYLKESKRFRELPSPTIPEATADRGDFYSTPDKELRLLGDGVTATITNDSAEVLFTLSVQKDSTSSEHRDALVRLVRSEKTWQGTEAVVVE